MWIGGRFHSSAEICDWNAFLLANAGSREDLAGGADHLGFAGCLESSGWAIGDGSLDFQIVAATGEDDPTTRDSSEFRTIAQSERDGLGAQGYWSYLVVTSPHGPSDVADLGIGLQNRGMGLITVQARWNAPLGRNWSSSLAAGWLRAAADSPLVVGPDIGVEIADTLRWDLGAGLALEFGAGYLFSGDFFRIPGGGSPDDLWEFFSRFQLEF
ncbi:MAG: hypothetical protein D6702_03550 [Planctomycetota bacterium]|nr:MAG: hypothetical protein D6702_03550 [Planctomycetota bacterium]